MANVSDWDLTVSVSIHDIGIVVKSTGPGGGKKVLLSRQFLPGSLDGVKTDSSNYLNCRCFRDSCFWLEC